MTHSDKSQKNWTFTSLDNDSLFQDIQLSEKTSTNLLTPRKLLLLRKRIWKNPKNEFSDFERWSKSTDKIGNKSGTFINKKW